MEFLVAFYEPEALAAAGAQGIGGRLPHLRLVSLAPRAEIAPILADLPRYVGDRVIPDPSPELLDSGRIEAILTLDPAQAARIFPDVAPDGFVLPETIAEAYERWLDTHYLPFNQVVGQHTPEGLFPAGWRAPDTRVEVIGSCVAEFLEQTVQQAARHFPGRVESFHTLKNHPLDGPPAEAEPTLRVVVPPLRFMHPETLDDFAVHPDHERLFAETRRHMFAWLASVVDGHPAVPLFVVGFLEPFADADGVFSTARRLSNLKFFVRSLNDAIVEWCEGIANAHFVDGDEVAATVGKAGVDDGSHSFFAHRGVMQHPTWEDGLDAAHPTVTLSRSIRRHWEQYYIALLRDILHRSVIIRGDARVKVVIFDLDNTLWRGLASDGAIGIYQARPQGLIEALKILKRRGIFVAVASKNDEAYIREHWDEILGAWSPVPLGCSLSLDDFDVVKIDFRPKSVNIAEILAELNVLPESAVFVDDNPLEREEVQAAFADIRVLGSELNSVRRELLHSPFTQAHVRTAEDAVRSATVRTQAQLQKHAENGSAAGFLDSLKLVCRVEEVGDLDSAAGRRAEQLINKTNQWNLNGERVGADGLPGRVFVAEAGDAGQSYGIVGAALVDGERVTHLVVSCRVIGMGIDAAFVHELLAACGPLRFAYRDSEKNRAARAFIAACTGAPPIDGDIALGDVEAPAHVRVETPAPLT